MSSFSNVDPDEEWYYLSDQTNEQQGPYPFGEFKNFYRLKRNDLIEFYQCREIENQQ